MRAEEVVDARSRLVARASAVGHNCPDLPADGGLVLEDAYPVLRAERLGHLQAGIREREDSPRPVHDRNRLRERRPEAPIDPGAEQVDRELERPAPQVLRFMPDGDRVVVGDAVQQLVPRRGTLRIDPAPDRAQVVPERERPARLDRRDDPVRIRRDGHEPLTPRTSALERASGKVTVNDVPRPSSLSTAIRPRCASTSRFSEVPDDGAERLGCDRHAHVVDRRKAKTVIRRWRIATSDLAAIVLRFDDDEVAVAHRARCCMTVGGLDRDALGDYIDGVMMSPPPSAKTDRQTACLGRRAAPSL